jgi:hypothetical protein
MLLFNSNLILFFLKTKFYYSYNIANNLLVIIL